MPELRPRHSKEEFARRGQEIYERVIRDGLRPEDMGKFVAIDIETGRFAINASDILAIKEIYELVPDAQPWMVKAGEKAACRFGMSLARGATSRSLRIQDAPGSGPH